MRVTAVKTFKVPPRWLFVKVLTDSEVHGWGEATLEGRVNTVEAAVHELAEYLIGRDPLPVLDHWQVLFRGGFYRGGPVLMSALAGLDQALWDIRGKYFNVPVYQLLGGPVRERIRVYAWIGGDDPEEATEQALARREQGFSAVKMNATGPVRRIDTPATLDKVVKRIAAVREAVGSNMDIAVDFHGRVSKSLAKILVRELEPLRPLFIEEPVLPEHSDALRVLSRLTSVPIATGERMYSRWEFKPLLEEGLIDVVQPDVSHAGGITECYRIGSMAEAYDVSVAPHCPLGPIALAACLQLDACVPNFLIQEMSLGIHYHSGVDLLDYVREPGVFRVDGGHVVLTQRPGLGIDIDEDRVCRASETFTEWRNPIWRLPDGAFTEW